jgi:uncharacterized membrane protein
MDTPLNRSAKFRADLKREIPLWLREGIVDDAAVRRLGERYELDALGKESSHLLAAVLFTLGGLLVGGGVISFVAANWDDIPTGFKVALLLAALAGFHAAGYWLGERRGWPRLGHALIFCGCLVFGANIGLFAQIFHISGEWYGGFFAWALGSLAVAWAARSWITGLLVLVVSFVWFGGFANDGHARAAVIYPFGVAAALLPLAWAVRSRVLYALTFAGVIAALGVLAGEDGNAARFVMLALALGGLMTWAVGEWHRVSGVRAEFGNVTAGLGLASLAAAAYVWSFRDIWQHLSGDRRHGFWWAIPVAAATLVGLALLVRARAAESAHIERRTLQAGVLLAALLLGGSAALSFGGGGATLPTVGANLAAIALAAVAVWSGIADERRTAFWLGSLFLVLLVISRFLEYETSLLTKSAAFIACGLAVMLAGTAYEKFLRRKEAVQ